MKPIELLAPAKNLEYGIAAIECGADAVYIGADMFGARYAAGNSVEDIGLLCDYAHQFGARVYVTMNTILYEKELRDAKALAERLCDVGVDALIVQDMSYLKFGLPIELHASTQTAAYSVERVRELSSMGFKRIVVERAMSLEEIERLSSELPEVELEAFVHGAICVSYSGQCYMGEIVSGRSGNRGVCSQPCRMLYNLVDQSGRVLAKQQHLLSVKDMMLSEHIGRMIDIGVASFKIEGRLKDISYLKSSVIHYRKQLDRELAKRSEFVKSSSGRCTTDIDANPQRSFTRGFSDYFALNPKELVGSFSTGKAIGVRVGRVVSCGKDFFTIDASNPLNNGDGVCFVSAKGEFIGTNINISDSSRIYPNKMDGITKGVEIFRNFDIKYNSMITSAQPRRRVPVSLSVSFSENLLTIKALDSDGIELVCSYPTLEYQEAQNLQKAFESLLRQLQRSGDTIFEVVDISISGTPLFIPMGEINRIRRDVFEKLRDKRVSLHTKPAPTIYTPNKIARGKLTYKGNVANSLARELYSELGYTEIDSAIELNDNRPNEIEAMTMRYCLRRERGECLREGGAKSRWFLESGKHRFELICDCTICRTKLIYRG